MKRASIAIALLLLTACAQTPSPTLAPGLIEDPLFTNLGRDGNAPWRTLQHAGPDSYRMSAAEGVLRIERFGPEPWGKVVQSVKVEELAGRTLEWSAEVRGELRMPAERFVTASGLTAVLIGRPPGAPVALGEGVLANHSAQPELPEGTLPWTIQRLRIPIPEGARRLEVGLILGHEGWIEIRRPSLRILP